MRITMQCQHVGSGPDVCPWSRGWDADRWTVTLRHVGADGEPTTDAPMVVDYYMGAGHRQVRPQNRWSVGGAVKVDDGRHHYIDNGQRGQLVAVPPDIRDVLDSIAADVACYDNARTPGELARELGIEDVDGAIDSWHRLGAQWVDTVRTFGRAGLELLRDACPDPLWGAELPDGMKRATMVQVTPGDKPGDWPIVTIVGGE